MDVDRAAAARAACSSAAYNGLACVSYRREYRRVYREIERRTTSMPALSALPDRPAPSSSCSWAAWSSLSCFLSSAQAWSSLTLVIAMAALVTTAMVSRRRHWSWHSPAVTPASSTAEMKFDLDGNWRHTFLAQSTSSAQAPRPLLPLPTIRRSSYPPADGGKSIYKTKSRPKDRILMETDFGVGITRRDTIEEIHGCRRHTVVVGGLEDTERHHRL